ncbi:sulfatase-like hydrolase/transferase [Roseimaritima sediminicola]|uniref:sulfatase-like hydrolase/transferase n=1 Tax=Roseimaritima sediminicola TaxID=2662066 RepID=UPI001298566F|nr:sulfatase-like hydrolase/transferase [Roseimaritima sediminicola]
MPFARCFPVPAASCLAAFLLSLIVLTATPGRAERPSDAPPNVVYIMADELGYYELSGMGNPNIQTPNLDRMAQQGIRFTQALAGSSVCAPTRACLMTGKHSGHTSVRSNGGGTPLRAGEATIASLLKPAGYATGGFGKWGCGGRGSTGVPEEHGFDVFLGYYDQVHAHSYYPPYIIRNSEEVPLEGNQGGSTGETYSHYVIFDASQEFIREHRDQPFFCYLPITPPHGLFDIPDDDPAWQVYKDRPWPEPAKRYAAMVTMVDRQVGQTLDLLGELGLEEDTIVFFCGDNGGADYFSSKQYPRGFHGANVNPQTGAEFRGRKGQLYEGGLRIPMMVRWPGKIQPGQVSDLLWYFPDVLPTVAELAGVRPPQDIDGMSIVPTLIGEEAAGRPQTQHDYLYWELGRQTAVREGKWKAIKPNEKKPWELYDLEQDISESDNIADQHPEQLAKMKAYAEEAHEPVEEGTFDDRTLHERDRRAKFGGRAPKREKREVAIPATNLVPHEQMMIAGYSSQNRGNGKLAKNAIDGDAGTVWHSRFSPAKAEAPHWLLIDLGKAYEISAVWYVARQDGGWNGTIADVRVSVGDDIGQLDHTPQVKKRLRKTREPQAIRLPDARGRYVKIWADSEINGGPWASAAEIAVEKSGS